jgi:hypothetical protein
MITTNRSTDAVDLIRETIFVMIETVATSQTIFTEQKIINKMTILEIVAADIVR